MKNSQLFICERCDSDEDVAMVYVNDIAKTYCLQCRIEIFTKKNKVGRPTNGTTKKVSITMSEENWEWLDQQAKGNRSKFIKDSLTSISNNTNKWDNQACMGYAIIAARNIGLSDQKLNELINEMKIEFDWKSLNRAKSIFNEFDI